MKLQYVKEQDHDVKQVTITVREDSDGTTCVLLANGVFIGSFDSSGRFVRNTVLAEGNRVRSGLAFDSDGKVVVV